MPPILSLRSTAWDWFRCWISSGASRVLHEPPDAEPHVRWCGRTAGVTPPPTRFLQTSRGARRELSVQRIAIAVPNRDDGADDWPANDTIRPTDVSVRDARRIIIIKVIT